MVRLLNILLSGYSMSFADLSLFVKANKGKVVVVLVKRKELSCFVLLKYMSIHIYM